MSPLDFHSDNQATRWSLILQDRGDLFEGFSAVEQRWQLYRDFIFKTTS